jgi:ATP-dependent DNA ligase
LAREHPAQIIVFDLPADEVGHSLLDKSFGDARRTLEAAFKNTGTSSHFLLPKATTSRETAHGRLKRLGHGLDGMVVKRLDLAYQSGERAVQRFKPWKTVDCVVGGIYYQRRTKLLEYLLTGLYDDAGRLNYVGRRVGNDGREI